MRAYQHSRYHAGSVCYWHSAIPEGSPARSLCEREEVPLVSGTKLGRYEIRSKLGEGGMGEVYLAQDTQLDRKAALKILLSLQTFMRIRHPAVRETI